MKTDYFKPENESVKCRREHLSPSGKYKLMTSNFSTKEGSWSYSQGKVFRLGSDEPIAVVQRNYSAFPFTFIEDHPNGHVYLIAGENYQGQTVIELDTGKRRDHLPQDAKTGHGFCWTESRFDPGTSLLAVCGCIWAFPYEFRFYDFSDPMTGWPELETESYIWDDAKWPTFEPDGTIKTYHTEEKDEDDAPDVLASIQTFRREGPKLTLLNEWVSDKEKAARATRIEGARKYEEWLQNFRATDPLYLAAQELMKDPAFQPEKYESVGITHDDWCPDFKGNESRMCRRLLRGKATIDLEWAVVTGPIKLVIFKGGNHVEDKFFEHSIYGMKNAFTYAKSVAQGAA